MKILLTSIIFICGLFGLLFSIKQFHKNEVKNSSIMATKVNSAVALRATLISSINVAKILPYSTIRITPLIAKPELAKIEIPSKLTKPTEILLKKIDGVAEIDVKKLVSATSAQGLQPRALESALNAYTWALHNKKLGSNKDILTVVDFTLPSYKKRMWVISLHQHKVLMKLYTTQGSGSGLVYATRFSNINMTKASSLGLYVTSGVYYGGHGKSMLLEGLQKGINNNARRRSIVIHEALYASPEYIRANHRAGRSWGCFAVAPAVKNKLLSYIRGGSAMFAYARQIEKSAIISHGPISL